MTADRPRPGNTFEDVVRRRLTRREALKVGLAIGAVAAAGAGAGAILRSRSAGPAAGGGVSFVPIQPARTDEVRLADGYRSEIVLRWGDPIREGAPEFDIRSQSAGAQRMQFGTNCDFVCWFPLPRGSASSTDGLLWVNHEHTDGRMMFHGYEADGPTADQVAIELEAHGATVARLTREAASGWRFHQAAQENRRITATTPLRISGPAAGTEWLTTATDPSGTAVLGMLGNCGGGMTPWHTVLTAEENFHDYFANASALPRSDPRRSAHLRYGIWQGPSERLWERHDARFDTTKHPNEPFRFGWLVEVDPYDPRSVPVKRTALGRFSHEAAACVATPDRRVVIYSGDDEPFEYVYKFVSERPYDPNNRNANADLLDAGTLYVARFEADGTGSWLPLVYGSGPLTGANGFRSQADVLIRARQAGDAVGATKMDRPEDIDVSPRTRKVYIVMTQNARRGESGAPSPDRANPRARNAFGHIIEVTEERDDFTASSFRWEIFLLAGDPDDPATYFAGFPKEKVSAIANPDNLAFDPSGTLWIATDGQPESLKVNDGIYAVPVDGPERGYVKQLLSAPVGAEVAGIGFTPDGRTLFASIQHPGEGSTLANPRSRWPGGAGQPPRPSVIAITRTDGRELAG